MTLTTLPRAANYQENSSWSIVWTMRLRAVNVWGEEGAWASGKQKEGGNSFRGRTTETGKEEMG